MRVLALLLSASLLLPACATSKPSRTSPLPPAQADGATLRRGQIVPLVDHHQHIFSEDLVDPPTKLLSAVRLPPAFERLLRDRERSTTAAAVSKLFTADAQVLDVFFDTDSWVTGPAKVASIVEQQGTALRFVPNAFQADRSAGFISGIVFDDAVGEYDRHFWLGLKRGSDGRWRIASEAITKKVDNPFRHPLDAKTLIMRLDDAGIQRATVLSTAFWLASPRRGAVERERERVRAANDWVISQTGLYPDRLIPFCSVNPLSDYAIEEADRCAASSRVRGIKLHFANGMIDLKNRDHLAKVRSFFRHANQKRLAIVVHLWPKGEEGPEYSRIFLDQVLSEAPDVPVQIAHLGSGAPTVFDATLGVFADAVAAGHPNTKNLFFDVTEIITEDLDDATVATLTRRMKQISLERILFGSDTPLQRYRPPPVQAWATFRLRVPLSDAELQAIADNVAPYLR